MKPLDSTPSLSCASFWTPPSGTQPQAMGRKGPLGETPAVIPSQDYQDWRMKSCEFCLEVTDVVSFCSSLGGSQSHGYT